ncbi:hypothetical protein PISMIDRAFT_682431 [Pisolithus microcarpus 441]|uniref:Uncharacterized protein n=1 Tax=Pisolithus microcarpus 441 TaxID=765257 RepID=A0A0C9XSZ6_9AGAM|nr:hypothetical protein PISMIDRAFT_687275 [Pisolithus microcarpus 441]KIK20261.1 hypothetical protein PISMIDRAFT_682431 [Pisolithus microcarpus 441]
MREGPRRTKEDESYCGCRRRSLRHSRAQMTITVVYNLRHIFAGYRHEYGQGPMLAGKHPILRIRSVH